MIDYSEFWEAGLWELTGKAFVIMVWIHMSLSFVLWVLKKIKGRMLKKREVLTGRIKGNINGDAVDTGFEEVVVVFIDKEGEPQFVQNCDNEQSAVDLLEWAARRIKGGVGQTLKPDPSLPSLEAVEISLNEAREKYNKTRKTHVDENGESYHLYEKPGTGTTKGSA